MTTDNEEQEERRATLQNDQRVAREQQRGSTYSQFGASDAAIDRDAHGKRSTVIGSEPIIRYPEQPPNSPFHHDPVGQEPPLNYSVDQMEPVGTAVEIEASIARSPLEPSPQVRGTFGDPTAPSNPTSGLMSSVGSPVPSDEGETEK